MNDIVAYKNVKLKNSSMLNAMIIAEDIVKDRKITKNIMFELFFIVK
jgi:hypothetical protein